MSDCSTGHEPPRPPPASSRASSVLLGAPSGRADERSSTDAVIATRSGDVLLKHTLLKSDHFPGVQGRNKLSTSPREWVVREGRRGATKGAGHLFPRRFLNLAPSSPSLMDGRRGLYTRARPTPALTHTHAARPR